MTPQLARRGVWSAEEHDRFLVALKQYPEGPWSAIAYHIGTRSTRQVQTHAQKYYEKLERRARGLLRTRDRATAREHRVDEAILTAVSTLTNDGTTSYQHERFAHRQRLHTRRGAHGGLRPPCLQRLSGAPPSPTGTDQAVVFRAMGLECDPKTTELEELLVPSVDQSLDFLIAFLNEEQDQDLCALLEAFDSPIY